MGVSNIVYCLCVLITLTFIKKLHVFMGVSNIVYCLHRLRPMGPTSSYRQGLCKIAGCSSVCIHNICRSHVIFGLRLKETLFGPFGSFALEFTTNKDCNREPIAGTSVAPDSLASGPLSPSLLILAMIL